MGSLSGTLTSPHIPKTRVNWSLGRNWLAPHDPHEVWTCSWTWMDAFLLVAYFANCWQMYSFCSHCTLNIWLKNEHRGTAKHWRRSSSPLGERYKRKNIHGARQRYSKSEKPVMLLMHWDRHAHRAAQGSGVKEGFHLFYLSPLFRLHRAHPFSPLFSLLQWGTDLNRADRNLPEWNAFLQ